MDGGYQLDLTVILAVLLEKFSFDIIDGLVDKIYKRFEMCHFETLFLQDVISMDGIHDLIEGCFYPVVDRGVAFVFVKGFIGKPDVDQDSALAANPTKRLIQGKIPAIFNDRCITPSMFGNLMRRSRGKLIREYRMQVQSVSIYTQENYLYCQFRCRNIFRFCGH